MSEGEPILYSTEDGIPVTMGQCSDKLDAFAFLNESDVLTPVGRLRIDVVQNLTTERFEVFDINRHATEALASDNVEIAPMKQVVKTAKEPKNGGGDA